jgi:biopolymer transport protein ExbB/TolQ
MAGKYMVNSRAPFISTWTKTYSESLAGALEAAWRKHNREWSVDSIVQEQKIIINSEELSQAFAQMDNLAHEQPKRSRHEISEQTAQEMNKALD